MSQQLKKEKSLLFLCSQKQKWTFLLPIMIELFEKNRMSHFPPFYDDFSFRNLTLKIGHFILRQFTDQNYANKME